MPYAMDPEPTSNPTGWVAPQDVSGPKPRATTVELADLPALESVAGGSLVPVMVGALFASFFALPAVGFIRYWRQVSTQGFAIRPLVALYVLAVVWLLFRALTLSISARADARGLAIRSLLRRRFVAWSEVQRVETRRSCLT